jgi:hypothetical protein
VTQGGDTGLPECQVVVLLLSLVSLVVSTVVGWGLGVMVIGTGESVVPPLMDVLDPTVSVVGGRVYVCEPKETTVSLCVVITGLSMEVVPFHTLFCLLSAMRQRRRGQHLRGNGDTYGVTVTVIGGGWIELVT